MEMEKIIRSVDVNFYVVDDQRGSVGFSINASLNEALRLLSMQCLSGLVVSLVPNYGLPSLPENSDEE